MQMTSIEADSTVLWTVLLRFDLLVTSISKTSPILSLYYGRHQVFNTVVEFAIPARETPVPFLTRVTDWV